MSPAVKVGSIASQNASLADSHDYETILTVYEIEKGIFIQEMKQSGKISRVVFKIASYCFRELHQDRRIAQFRKDLDQANLIDLLFKAIQSSHAIRIQINTVQNKERPFQGKAILSRALRGIIYTNADRRTTSIATNSATSILILGFRFRLGAKRLRRMGEGNRPAICQAIRRRKQNQKEYIQNLHYFTSTAMF